ncbi:MAG TPA: hypothetical protein VGJ01_17655 [Pseudolabrys sp.]|jgi:hypothetical protein
MASIRIGLLVLAVALSAGAARPASAEFFGCNDADRPGRVLYSYNGTPGAYGTRSSRARYTHDFAAQSRPRRTHVTYYASKRYWHERSRR